MQIARNVLWIQISQTCIFYSVVFEVRGGQVFRSDEICFGYFLFFLLYFLLYYLATFETRCYSPLEFFTPPNWTVQPSSVAFGSSQM